MTMVHNTYQDKDQVASQDRVNIVMVTKTLENQRKSAKQLHNFFSLKLKILPAK
jgi:hypothetical protein